MNVRCSGPALLTPNAVRGCRSRRIKEIGGFQEEAMVSRIVQQRLLMLPGHPAIGSAGSPRTLPSADPVRMQPKDFRDHFSAAELANYPLSGI